MKRLLVTAAIASAAVLGGGAVASAATNAPASASGNESGGGWAWVYTQPNYGGTQTGIFESTSVLDLGGSASIKSVINHSGYDDLCGYSLQSISTGGNVKYDFGDGGSSPTIGAPFSASDPLNDFAWYGVTVNGTTLTC